MNTPPPLPPSLPPPLVHPQPDSCSASHATSSGGAATATAASAAAAGTPIGDIQVSQGLWACVQCLQTGRHEPRAHPQGLAHEVGAPRLVRLDIPLLRSVQKCEVRDGGWGALLGSGGSDCGCGGGSRSGSSG